MTKIYDLSNPAKPVFIRDFGLAGQQPGSTVMPIPTELHGPISLGPKGNRVYFAYGTNSGGVVQIVDRDKLLNGPKEPTDANLAVSADRARRSPAGRRRALGGAAPGPDAARVREAAAAVGCAGTRRRPRAR